MLVPPTMIPVRTVNVRNWPLLAWALRTRDASSVPARAAAVPLRANVATRTALTRTPPSRAAWMMMAIAILAAILLSRTTYGRYVYAIGGNTQAARLGGVRVNAIRVSTFALSGTAAALAGTLDASRVLSAQASSGQFLTFTVLTGIIVGGTSILGGEGTIGRTVLGCLFVALIANGFNLLGLDPFYQQVTLGVILLLAVGVDAWSRRFE